MNGAHDLGGTMGFGAVVPEAQDAPHYGSDWERRTMALTLACAILGRWSIDESRHVREDRPPALYLTSPYYRIWFDALEALLVGHGIVGDDELQAGRSLRPGADGVGPVSPDRAAVALRRGAPVDREPQGPAAFAVGQAVRARNVHPTGHTRLPRYARGKRGVIHAVRGCYVFPDTHAHGQGEQPQPMYTVCFEGDELWGPSSEPRERVYIDLWESYLEPDERGSEA